LWIVLWLNVAVAAAKLAVGFGFNLMALVADGVHSVLDASSNIVGLVGVSLAARPPDPRHPYGHRRFESLAALLIGGLIASAFFQIVARLWANLRGETEAPEVTWTAAIVVAVTILVNAGISRYETAQGRLHGSAVLLADSAHTKSDALASIAVLVSFGGVAFGFRWADSVGALVVAYFVGRTAWSVIRNSVLALSDSAQLSEQDVEQIAMAVPGVRGVHKVRSRGEPSAVQLDLHIQLDAHLSLVDAHRKTHEVKEQLMRSFPTVFDVVIHTEPAQDGAPSQA
jgi:cation diffusion facilitator family transporter